MVILERSYEDDARFVKLFGRLEDKDIEEIASRIEGAETPFERTSDFLIQLIHQSQVRDKPCTEWNVYPSKTMVFPYSNYVPLSIEELDYPEREEYESDLTDSITIVTENASRPVDYWFVPNKYWRIEGIERDELTLRATTKNTIVSRDPTAKQTLVLPTSAFLPAISRSLRNYRNCPPIIPEDWIDNYFLADENRESLREYREWGERAHEERLVGRSHSSYTPTKNAGGLVTKIDFLKGKTLALRFLKPMVGTQVIRLGFMGRKEIDSDLFFAYLTCSLFLLDALDKSRTRRAEFSRINQVDFYGKYRFPNLPAIEKDIDNANRIVTLSKKHNHTSLVNRPSFPEMVREARKNPNSTLRKLDEAWFETLGLPSSFLDVLYREIEERLADIIAATAKQR